MQQGHTTARWRRAALSACLAASAVVTGTCRVAADFQVVRARLVVSETRPADGRTLTRVVPVTSQPLSVVVVNAHGGQADAVLDVRVDGRLLARTRLPAGRTARVDVQVGEALVAGARLECSCASPGWTLVSLEAANLHGFTKGLLNAWFLPASRRDFRAIPAWLMIVAGAALFAIRVRPAPRVPPIEHAMAATGLLLFALAIVSPLVSPYLLLLAMPTFLLGLVLVFGLPAWRSYGALRARTGRTREAAAYALDAAVVVALVLVSFVAATRHGLQVQGGDYSGFLHLSHRFVNAPVLDDHPELRRTLPSGATGYDGQFMYLMAFDPLLTRFPPARYGEVVDSPPYRYGRIGFSLLTWAFSAGDPARFPRTMVWLILAAHAVCACFLVLIARQRGAGAWQVLPYLLIPGSLVSLGNALPESIAAALLVAGLWSYLRSRRTAAILLWSFALLVRETGVVLMVAIVIGDWLDRRDWRRAGSLLLAALPVAAWRAYVGWRLAPAWGAAAWWHEPREFGIPFAGLARLWSTNDVAHGYGQAYNLWFPLILVALLVLAVMMFKARPTLVAGAAVAYALLAISLDYQQVWSWLGNGERVSFEAFLMVLVAALPFGRLPRGLRWGLAAFGAVLFVYDFQIGTYATWFRPALLVFG